MKHCKRVSAHPVRYAALIFLIVMLAGCATVGPDYIRPETSLSPTWHNELKDGLTVGEMNLQTQAEWWATFNDPILNSLIARAIKKNLSLEEAVVRVREARARRGIAKADIFPAFDFKGNASWSRDSKVKETSEFYSTGIDSSWELDIFGGNRRSLEASQASLEADIENVHDVLVSLLAEVSLNYIEVRSFQKRLAIAEANITVQNEAHQLSIWRFQAGLSDELAVQQARYNLENTRSQIPTLRTGLQESMNRIAVLLGEHPGVIHDELMEAAEMPTPPAKILIATPADILMQRPDIRRAERELAAQTARVGVATADLYPKISLTGSIGLEALSLSSLFSSATKIAGGSSLLTLPIFRSGAILQNIEVQSALQEQALIRYKASILNALEEVENAIVAYSEEQNRRDALDAAVNAAMKAADMAMQKYKAGLSDFNDVLESQRSLLSFQDQLVQSKGIIIINLIKLYKSLGGGWKSMYPDDKETALEMEKYNGIKD